MEIGERLFEEGIRTLTDFQSRFQSGIPKGEWREEVRKKFKKIISKNSEF